MNEQEPTTQQAPTPTKPGYFEEAVEAITAGIQAANAGRGTDGAEFIAQVLATVAANLGSTSQLTAARPGSWEADYVARLVHGTVGTDDEYLLSFRTTPVEIVVSIDDELGDLGMWETYVASVDHIGQAMFGDRWDRTRGQLTFEELEAIEAAEALVYELADRDAANYQERFAQTVQAELAALRHSTGPDAVEIPADLTVTVRFVTYPFTDKLTDTWDSGYLERHLYGAARDKTPLPGADTAPTCLWGPVDEVLATTRWPHARIPELAHYRAPTTPNGKGR